MDEDVVLIQTLDFPAFERLCGFGDPDALERQLRVDVPRQTTSVDGGACPDSPSLLRALPGGLRHPMAQFCTQAALSWPFCVFHEAYGDLPRRAVTDGGRATYAVDTASRSLAIEKTFDLVSPLDDGGVIAHIRCTTDVSEAGVLVSWHVAEVPRALRSPCGCVLDDWFGPGGTTGGLKKKSAPTDQNARRPWTPSKTCGKSSPKP